MAKRWWKDNNVITDDNTVITKNNKGKENKGKENKGKENKGKEIKHKYWFYKHVFLLDKQKQDFIKEYSENIFDLYIKKLDEYIETTWKKYKNHYLVMKNWKRNEKVSVDINKKDVDYSAV